VSCPALPRDLLESELFGHEKGAFTGAIKRRIGKIESAAGGTLFLDEIGDLPLDLQPKLLNVLQDRQFQRVGGEATISADVRIIAATNVDFETKIREGSFREDLFYRLSVIPLEIPPLRDRSDEIDPLMMKILSDISKRRKCHLIQVTDAVRDAFKAYHWPGNVREMENILERCSAFCEQGVIKIGDLPKELKKTGPTTTLATVDGLGGVSLEELERQALMQTLQLCQGNKADAARRLGISEKSVYNKIKYYGINGA
jgi:DNA-binding NtrC family response regulator